MRVLSIDPGSNFGWALFEDGELEGFDDFAGRANKHFGRYAQVHALLTEFFSDLEDKGCVVIENVVQGSKTMPSWQGVWHTTGFQYLVTELAEDMGIPVGPVGNQTLKAYLRRQLGLSGKAKVEKKQIVEYVNKKYDLNLKQKDHNKADAICLGELFYAKAIEAHRLATGGAA